MLAPAGSEPDSTVTVPAGPEGPTSRGRLAGESSGSNGEALCGSAMSGTAPGTWLTGGCPGRPLLPRGRGPSFDHADAQVEALRRPRLPWRWPPSTTLSCSRRWRSPAPPPNRLAGPWLPPTRRAGGDIADQTSILDSAPVTDPHLGPAMTQPQRSIGHQVPRSPRGARGKRLRPIDPAVPFGAAPVAPGCWCRQKWSRR